MIMQQVRMTSVRDIPEVIVNATLFSLYPAIFFTFKSSTSLSTSTPSPLTLSVDVFWFDSISLGDFLFTGSSFTGRLFRIFGFKIRTLSDSLILKCEAKEASTIFTSPFLLLTSFFCIFEFDDVAIFLFSSFSSSTSTSTIDGGLTVVDLTARGLSDADDVEEEHDSAFPDLAWLECALWEKYN